eukprot:TRINITY_DN13994_c0_g1_i1.p1 TRINITY_DN13994_c0_g1~~TRINITY_DN13994_c0_g1_i1.p1  ORF type:complete len:479 (-),score=53.95 TRINITY_DN13994_c0_g1_i1:389-1786(-)
MAPKGKSKKKATAAANDGTKEDTVAPEVSEADKNEPESASADAETAEPVSGASDASGDKLDSGGAVGGGNTDAASRRLSSDAPVQSLEPESSVAIDLGTKGKVVEDSIGLLEPGKDAKAVRDKQAVLSSTEKATKRSCMPSRHALIGIVSVLIWIVAGILFFSLKEGKDVVTGLYIMVQMLTTIGYGDLTIQSSEFSKVFLTIYSLFTAVVIAQAVTDVCHFFATHTMHGVGERLRGEDDGGTKKPALFTPVRRAMLYCCLVLLAGTIFYGSVESCTCSYGESFAAGCDEDKCAETGGYQMSYLDALYMSCISLTTVGFGDFAPKSYIGRVFAVPWMVIGVVIVANFQCRFTETHMRNQRMGVHDMDLEELYDHIDLDGNGSLSRFEFLTFALLEYGLIDDQVLDEINEEFDVLDKDRSGCLSKEEILSKFERLRNRENQAASKRLSKPQSAIQIEGDKRRLSTE